MEYVRPDGTVPTGPNWLLPKKNLSGASANYEGLTSSSFPRTTPSRFASTRPTCATQPTGPRRSDRAATKNHYPTQFDLFTADELAKTIALFQGILAAAENTPSARNPIPASWSSLPTEPRPHWLNRSKPSPPTTTLERRSRSG